MKLIFIFSFTLLIAINGFAQNYLTQARPADKKEWGYIDEKGEFIIEAKYRKCYKFSEGYAPIYQGKKFFFINEKGAQLNTELTDFRLKSAFGFGLLGFEDGMVPVLVEKQWGYINTEGKTAITPQYLKASKFNGGFAVVKKEDNFIIVNKTGTETVIPEIIDLRHFSEGLAPFKSTDKKFGFINTSGEKAIPAQFASVGYFFDGLAWAKTLDRKIGFINKKGEWVIQPQFVAAKDFDVKSGLAMVKDNEKWLYTDKFGNTITVLADKINSFSNGLAKGKKGEKIGYFNKEGKWVIEPKFEGGRDFNNGFAAVKQDGKWGFIDEKGEWAVQPTFGTVKDMELIK
jgi:hypothetical protein